MSCRSKGCGYDVMVDGEDKQISRYVLKRNWQTTYDTPAIIEINTKD